jgi:hypothetical protein
LDRLANLDAVKIVPQMYEVWLPPFPALVGPLPTATAAKSRQTAARGDLDFLLAPRAAQRLGPLCRAAPHYGQFVFPPPPGAWIEIAIVRHFFPQSSRDEICDEI